MNEPAPANGVSDQPVTVQDPAPAPAAAPPFSLAAIANAPPEVIKSFLETLGPAFKEKARAALLGDAPVQHAAPAHAPPPPQPFPEPAAPRVIVPEFRFAPPPGFKPLRPDFLLYDPRRVFDVNRRVGPAILCIPWMHIELPKQTSAGRAIIARCIEPVPCINNADQLVESRPGEDILIEVNHWLRSLLRRVEDKDTVGEVWLQPVGMRPCEGGDFMMSWRIEFGPTHPRSSIQQTGALPHRGGA